jgi:hypothetical protein
MALATSLVSGASAQTTAESNLITVSVKSTGSVDTATIESGVRPIIDTALDELSSLFNYQPNLTLAIAFGSPPDEATRKRLQSVDDLAWIDPAAGTAIVDLNLYTQRSPVEAGNVIRNLVARLALFEVTGGALSAGLNDGIASYFERPVLAEQARRGSLVQQVDIAQELPDLTTLVNASPTLLDPETSTSLHYAFAAFIAEHYGIASLQQVVLQSRGSTNWQAPLTGATGQTIDQVATAWDQFLPRWFSGGWQFNAFNGFDMSMAQGLFDRGAYASAISMAEQSQALFSQLNDTVRLSEVEGFISLNAIGVRAEQLMKEVQTSLEAFDYDRANSKLIEAEEQYAYLPESHRPGSLISTWRSMIDSGLKANANAAEAYALAGNWSNTREARDYAITSGNGFAAIGDAERAQASQQLVSNLNLRLQRITLAAIAVVILVAVWLWVWLWARAPRRFQWQDRRHLVPSLGRSR